MSSFGDFPQGSVSAGYQPVLVDAVPPGGSAPRSGSRRLLVAAIMVLSLLVVAGVVVLLFVLGASRSHSEPSLANGLKVSLNKLVVIQVEGDDEGVAVSRPYSVFLPGGDLAVFAPVREKVYYNVVRQDTGSKVSPGKAKISWPEDADESGGVLESCESGQRYSLENNVMACADVAVPKAAGEKEGFGQVLYSGKDLKIVASPGVDSARALSGFSPDGRLLWSKELATPGQVSFDGSNIIVTSFEGSKVSIEGYGGVEEGQKSSESPALVGAAKGPDKDAIKAFDYKNSFALATTTDNSDCTFFNEDGSAMFLKLPDTNDGCWYSMVEGESQEVTDMYGPELGELPWLKFDGRDSLFQPEYTDVNSDGFLDLLVTGGNPECSDDFVYIFDPADPEHPFVAFLGGFQDPAYHPEYKGNGEFEAAGTRVGGRCVTSRFRVENDANGVPRVVDYQHVDYQDPSECL